MAVPGRKVSEFHGTDSHGSSSDIHESVSVGLTSDHPVQPVCGSISHGSAEDFNNSCDSCITEGQHIEAHGYCVDCKEYLCRNCFKYHQRTKALKHHQIVDKDNMNKLDMAAKPQETCTEKCKIHKDEIIKFFCPTHDVLGCSDCITMNHRVCDIDYIPDKCTDIGASAEYKDVMSLLDQKATEVDAVVNKAKNKDTTIDACHEKALQDMDKFKQELSDHISEHYKDIKATADARKAGDKQKIQNTLTSCSAISLFISKLKSTIDENKADNHSGQMFIAIKRAKSNLKSDELEKTKESLEETNVEYTFKRENELKSMLSKCSMFGQLIDSKDTSNTRIPYDTHSKNKSNTRKDHMSSSKDVASSKIPLVSDSKVIGNSRLNNTMPSSKDVDNSKKSSDSNAKQSGKSKTPSNKDAANSKMTYDSIPIDKLKPNTPGLDGDKSKPSSQDIPKTRPPHTLSHTGYINVRTETDLETCGISACALLSSERLILADTDNMKLKIVQICGRISTIVDEKILYSPPKDLALLPNAQAAVTIPDKKKILIVTTAGQLSIKNTIHVEGICRGLTYHQDSLYVVCWNPYCVFVLEMDGKIKYAFPLPSKFLSPHYIVYNPVFQLIYVSDKDRHSVCSLTLQGDITSVYCSKKLRPAGMVMLDDGSLLVCNQFNDTIHCISGDLKQSWQVAVSRKPLSMCYSFDRKEVFIGASNSDRLRTFALQ